MKGRQDCYGCAGCAYICKHGAISMAFDREGFAYPSVDSKKCVSCGLCEHICPENKGSIPVKTYSGRLSDETALYGCASGGAFTAIATSFLQNGGVVYAACDNLKTLPSFIKISKVEDLVKVQGSKYFQINLTQEIYIQIRDSLRKTRVLFCGTPCQVAAVKKVFQRYADRLFTIDLICGGVPAYKLVKQYRNYKERKFNHSLVEHCFRAKNNPSLHGYQSRLVFDDGTIVCETGEKDEYTRLFSSGITLRQSCYRCEFSNEKRVGDITIGDFWGINSQSKFYHDRGMGVSLFICNTAKGVDLVTRINSIEIKNVDFDEVKRYNRPLRAKAKARLERIFALKIMNLFPFKLAVNLVCYRYLIKKLIKR